MQWDGGTGEPGVEDAGQGHKEHVCVLCLWVVCLQLQSCINRMVYIPTQERDLEKMWNVDSMFQVQLEGDRGHSIRQNGIETSGQWTRLHWECQRLSQVSEIYHMCLHNYLIIPFMTRW